MSIIFSYFKIHYLYITPVTAINSSSLHLGQRKLSPSTFICNTPKIMILPIQGSCKSMVHLCTTSQRYLFITPMVMIMPINRQSLHSGPNRTFNTCIYHTDQRHQTIISSFYTGQRRSP